MKFSIRTHGSDSELIVTEGKVVCTLKIGATHDITTKGDDVDGIAMDISRSYRNSAGKGCVGRDYLKLIRADLIKRNDVKKTLDNPKEVV